MPSTKSNPERFRSATEFPRTLQGLESAEAEKLYLEMRDCLIFTNRSRSQLMRHNNGCWGKVTQPPKHFTILWDEYWKRMVANSGSLMKRS
jgi:hypothetical protein